MLNLKEIADRIAHPSHCGETDTEDLKKLCETYPYSQVFPILYLNVLSKSNDVRFDEELQRYAYRISDRTMLYNLLHQTNFEVEENPQEIKLETQATQEIQKVEEKIEPIIEEKVDVPVIPEPEIEEAISEIEVEKIEESLSEVIAESAAAEGIDTTEEIELIDLIVIDEEVPEIQEEIEVVHFELDLNDDKVEEINEKPKTIDFIDEEPLVVAGFESIPIDEVFQKLEEAQQQKDLQFKDELTARTIASAYSIEEEEKRIAKLNEVESTKVEQIKDEIINPEISLIEEKKSFSSWLHSNENYSESKEEKIAVDMLISKFIEESPKISPINEKLFEGRKEKKEFYSPIKKAKESLDEQNLPVSETLAKVFAAQGNFPKAIYAYEQLMLIIPEKKIFFAVQIKELEQKLNK